MNLTEKVEGFIKTYGRTVGADAEWEAVYHLRHDEIEYAFEGLVIDLMKAGIRPSQKEGEGWLQLAEELGLWDEGVIDADFGDNLRSWLGSTDRDQ